MSEHEFIVKLDPKFREDGSVLICSQDLPLFSVVGRDREDALDLVLDLLPEYLRANVPEFVKLRPASSIDSVTLKKDASSLPIYMIAELGGEALGQQREEVPA